MTDKDYWLVGILVLSYFATTWRRGPLVRAGILWLCLWLGAARMAVITGQIYTQFLASDAYRLNNKQEEPWILALVLCSAGIAFLVVVPIIRFHHEWRSRYKGNKSAT